MKILCKKTDLEVGLAIVNHAITTNSTLPILHTIKLETTSDGLRLSATNLEVGIQCLVAASVLQPGSTTLPAKKFTNYITSLPYHEFTIESSSETFISTITSGDASSATMRGMDPIEFPSFPDLDAATSLSLDSTVLKELVKSVGFAASPSDSDKPILTGIYLEIAERIITCAAADGFHLAVQEMDLAQPIDSLKILVPAKTFKDVAAILPDQQAVTVGVTTIRNQVLFRTPTITVCSRLLEGAFVNFRSVIPDSYTLRAVMETSLFHAILKAATLFAQEGDSTITLNFQPKDETVVIEASAPDLGISSCRIPAVFSGEGREPITIRFNESYLNNICTAVGSFPELAIELHQADNPGIIKPVCPKRVTYLIMPMHRRN